MSSSNLNREQIAYLEKVMQAFVVVNDPFAGDPLLQFIKSKMQIQSAKFDEQRQKTLYVNQTNGTIGEVNSAGVPSGVQFDENLVEHQITWKEYAGELPLIRRNLGKLDTIISKLGTSAVGIEEAVVALQNSTWGEEMKQKIINKIKQDVRSNFTTFLDGNPTIFGTDDVYANSGTLYNFDNLISGASIDDDGMELLENVYNNMEDEDGNKVFATVPNVFLCKPAYLSSLKTQLMKSSRVNVNSRGPIDVDNTDIKYVGSLPTSNNNIYSFSSANGLIVPVESMEPQVHLGMDERGNMLMTVYFLYGFGFAHRIGTAKQVIS